MHTCTHAYKHVVTGQIWARIEDVVIKALLSADAVLRHNYRACFPNRFVSSACFEVLALPFSM